MRGRLIVVLLVLLVAADVVLITLAVRRGHGGTVVAADGAQVTAARTTRPTRSHTSGDGSGQALVAGAESVVLRATTGSCQTGDTPVLEVSTDSGATFTPTAEGLGVAQVLRVAVVSASDLWFIGTDDMCTPSIWHSAGAGTGWTRSPGTQGVWHVEPAAGSSAVHAPTGRVPVGCSVASLSPIDGQTARVLCTSGTVLGTTDGGTSWVILGHLDAQIMDYDSPANGVALGSTSSCDVEAFVTGDGGALWTRTGCLQGAHAHAVAYQDGGVIALVDKTLLISGDGGQTWSLP